MKRLSLFGPVLLAFCLTLPAFSADPPLNEGGKPEWMKLTVPTENHKALNDLVGKWNFSMKFWMTPDATPGMSKGTSTSKWIMGGRFVQQDTKSKMMGEKFEGMGLTGYDNVKQEYQSMWIDNMSTGMMMSNGTKDATTNTLTQTGTFACPMSGDKAKWFRNELKMVSKNEHVFEMYSKHTDGTEFKSMEITYVRAK